MASKRIAGITIELDAKPTKLIDALKSVDKELGKSKSNLKDIDKLLKLDPGNVTLLSQKQKDLQSSISKTKDRLKELKSVNKDSVSSEEWDDLQREIIDTEQNLKSLETEYKNFGSVAAQQVKAVGDKMQAVGDKISGVGKGLTQKVTAPIAAGFGAALKVTADFDSQMSKVAAISGATGDDFEALRAKAREMGAATKFSATEAGEAFEYMAMAGWKTDDMLNGISGVMNLAAASGEDLGTTSDIVTDALTAFGKTAADAGDFADVLAQASSNANTNVGMMGETFKYVAPVAGALGYDYRDVAVATGLMANSGIKASQAGTALRGLFTRLAKPTKESSTAMEALGVSMTNADGSMKPLSQLMVDLRKKFAGLTEAEKAQYAAMLAGQNGMSGMLAIVNASDEDFNSLTESIQNSSGAAQRMADRMNDNLSGQLTILKSQLEELAISIGEQLTPYARKLVGVVQKVVDRFNKLSPRTKRIVTLVGAAVAAIGPLLVGVGGVVSMVGKAIAVLSPLATVLTGPVGIIAAVAALTATVLTATGAWGKIKDAVVNAWPGIKQAVVSGVETVKKKFGEFKEYLTTNLVDPLVNLWNTSLKPVFDQIAEAFEPVRKSAAATWDVIKGIFNGWNTFGDLQVMLGDLWQRLKEFGGKLGTILSNVDWKGIASSAWEIIKSAFAPAAQWFKDLFESAKELIKEIDWAAVGTTIWNGVKAVGGWIGNMFSAAWAEIKKIDWAAIGQTIWAGMKAVGGWIGNMFSAAWAKVKEIDWSAIGQTIWAGAKAVGGWIKGMFGTAWEKAKEIDWAAIGTTIWNGVKAVGGQVKGLFDTAWGNILKIDWTVVGKTIWNGVKTVGGWVKGMFDTAWSKILKIDWATVGTTVWNGVKAVGGKLKEMFGTAWGEILKIDWTVVGKTVWNGVKAVGGWVKGMFDTAWDDIKKIDWSAVGKTIADKIKGNFGTITDWFRSKFSTVGAAIKGINWGNVGKAISDKIKSGFSTLKDKIKKLLDFSNIHIKLPHFRTGLAAKNFGIFGTHNVPTLWVEWYKKAYDSPIMFTRPTVVNTPAGPKGFGDGNGGEVVLSEAKLRQLVGSGSGAININITINQQPGESSQALAERVQRVLVQWDRQRKAVLG